MSGDSRVIPPYAISHKAAFPFPLDDGDIAYLWLPVRCLTASEAARLSQYVMALSESPDLPLTSATTPPASPDSAPASDSPGGCPGTKQ